MKCRMQLLFSCAIFPCHNDCIRTFQKNHRAFNALKFCLYARPSRREGEKRGPSQSVILLANKKLKSPQVTGSICCFLSSSASLSESSTEILVTDCFFSLERSEACLDYLQTITANRSQCKFVVLIFLVTLF